MIPARFIVMRQMLVLLQYILEQPDSSLMARVYQAQIKSPSKGDWASETAKIVHDFGIQLTNNEIKNMKVNQFKVLVKKKTYIAALNYLCKKQQKGKRGKYIKYEQIQMAIGSQKAVHHCKKKIIYFR